MRIHIMGAAGSGKTTLAHRLAAYMAELGRAETTRNDQFYEGCEYTHGR